MKVRFNVIYDFIEEMEANPPPSGYIRVTFALRETVLTPVRESEVRASYLDREGHLVLLIARAGEDWGPDHAETAQTLHRGELIWKALRAAATERGLSVRGGLFDE